MPRAAPASITPRRDKPSSADSPAPRCSAVIAPSPIPAVTSDGTTDSTSAVGRARAAHPAIATITPSSPRPYDNRRRASSPAAAASSSVTITTPLSSTSLSALPKVRIAQLFTGSGVASMTADPTAYGGEASARTSTAMRWPAPAPATVAAMPMRALPR